MNKKLLLSFFMIIGLVASQAQAGLITSTVGDEDCFGLGGVCVDGDLWRDELGGGFFGDYRSASDIADAPYTDIWDTPIAPSWAHDYDLAGATVVSATFDLMIAGFADTGSTVNLLADGVIIDSYDFYDLFQTVHLLTVNVANSFIDGSTVFSLDTAGSDGYIIDYSSLNIVTSTDDHPVPAPGALALLALGLAGLRLVQKK